MIRQRRPQAAAAASGHPEGGIMTDTMRPAADAGRPSCLAANPRNREASAARRERLLAAFDSLDVNTRADLLEAVESLAGAAGSGVNPIRDEARRIIAQVYVAAGWREDPA
jgi:hypothetical protein